MSERNTVLLTVFDCLFPVSHNTIVVVIDLSASSPYARVKERVEEYRRGQALRWDELGRVREYLRGQRR